MMKADQNESSGEPLSPGERARLRREVDADALDRLLMKAPTHMRAAIIAASVERVTNADLMAIGFEPSELDEDTLEGEGGRGSLSMGFEPNSELQQLWDATRPESWRRP